jgi:hypothetical protein
MNIFYIDENPLLAAKYAANCHVVKMVSETCQIISTAYHFQSTKIPPKALTHDQHPCCKWVRQSKENAEWLTEYLVAINTEYEFRFGKEHKDAEKVWWLKDNLKHLFFFDSGFTPPPLATPEDCWSIDHVASYRLCYSTHKRHLLKYYYRRPPSWLNMEFDYFPELQGFRLPEHKDWSNKR